MTKSNQTLFCYFAIFILSQGVPSFSKEELPEIGARPIGMGGAFIAIAEGSASIRRNPGGLAQSEAYTFEFNQSPSKLFGQLRYNHLSLVLPRTERAAVGIDWGQIRLEDDELFANHNSFHFSYSYKLTSIISVGANLKYLTNSVSLDLQKVGSDIGWGSDFGIFLESIRNINLGLFVQDFIGFGTGKGLQQGTWIRHNSGINEKVFSTAYKFGIAYRPNTQWLIATDFTDRFHFGAEFSPNSRFTIRTGLQTDFHGEMLPTYTLGGGIRYKSTFLDLAYLIPTTLPATAYMSLSINFDFRKLPIQIEQVRIRDIFPTHYNFYARPNREAKVIIFDNPNTPPNLTSDDLNRYFPILPQDTIGRIWLKNTSQKPVTIRIEIFVDDFVSKNGTEVAANIELPPMRRVSVPIRQIVLTRQAVELTQTHPVETRVRVSESGGTASRTVSTTIILHGNKMTLLDDISKLSSFISSDNLVVRDFINQIRTKFQDKTWKRKLPKNLFWAMLLFNSLHGISYAADPNIPLESGTIDEIQHPHEMLQRFTVKTEINSNSNVFGDCDDSTVLYCSILESVGINTALIQFPEHVMMAFDLGNVSLEQAQNLSISDVYIAINGLVWIPIETTMIKDGFVSAWQMAIEQLQGESIKELATVESGWAKYGASSIQDETQLFSIPENQIQKQIEIDLTSEILHQFSQVE